MGRTWVTLFNAAVWTIWEAQNQVVFKGISAELAVFVDLVRFRVVWWFKHHGKGSAEPITVMVGNLEVCCFEQIPQKVYKAMAWVPPPKEVLKFNVDGSFKKEIGRAGIGGVLLNSRGEVLCSFSAFVGNVDASTAELLAIQKACFLCVSKASVGRRKICIESDSRVAVSWVKDDDFGNLALVDVIYDICSKLRLLGKTSVNYIARDANVVADGLAKRGVALDGENVVWSFCQ
ncbi:hypothetical protein Dsin_022693 [Dipteronia sinensis]|uniref:RNase H type-1 domain-containing protein n=1 Tax=Dipteronia sinensis TaxID=43782 RepID=A0AAE0A299_9ROSI|nr:hypothetical protein Dsin_022693 [Dipteronia sinensis]